VVFRDTGLGMDMMHDILAQALRTQRVEQQIELARWSSGNDLLVGGILTVAFLYAVVWMYRREARGHVSLLLRSSMIICRIAVLVLLGFIGLEPVIVNIVHRKLEAATIVLVDGSASMGLSDSYRRSEDSQRVQKLLPTKDEKGWKRAELQSTILLENQKRFLKELAAKNPVSVYTFGDKPVLRESVTADRGATTQPADDKSKWMGDPEAPATNLGIAVRGVLESLAGAPAAGVVVLSDGNFNQGETAETIGRMLKQKGVPLYAVGIGDPAPPINVSVTEVNGPRYAFKNDPFNVSIRLSSEGLSDESVNVELLERAGTNGEFKPVGNRTVRPDATGRLDPLSFERKISAPGTISYAARVSPVPFESVTSDNQREMSPAMQVLDDKMAVLIVSGAPSYDHRFLTRMLERDPGIEVSTWLQSADVQAVREGTRVITELPATQEELYKYDAILLLDCDPNEFDPTWASMVSSFVSDHGGGLLVQAGNKYTGKFLRSPKAAPIVEILPVIPDPDAEILLNELGQYQLRAWPMIIPDQAALDPILRLSDNMIENRSLWSALEGIYWHFPVRREKPVANVLMRHSDPRMVNGYGPHVLLATQFVGAGRAAWMGFNSTWRWRRFDEKYFNRFWIQMLRFLVEGRLMGGGNRGQILTQNDQYSLGDSINVTIRALDERFEPLSVAELELQAEQGGTEQEKVSRKITATPITGREGFYQARLPADHVGILRLSVDLPGHEVKSTQPPRLTREITIAQSDIEMRNTAMNRAALQQLATVSGGRYFEMDETGKISELIQDASRTIITRERPVALWDNWKVFTLLLVVLSAEWILRKKARLL
jgi:hypothetical protein